jgi:hypothetical protein
MTQTDSTPQWIQAVPHKLQPYVKNLEDLATTTLKNEAPYHSFRITPQHFEAAGNDYAGRLIGWSISITTQVGWEYENTTSDGMGTMWLMFKNPYIFS